MTRDPQPPPPLPTAPPTYQQPPQPALPVADYAGSHRACRGCGGGPLEEPGFTWWGGLVGHKILGVEQCKRCNKWWVKSTGQPGDTRVAVYMITGIVLGILIGGVWVYYMMLS